MASGILLIQSLLLITVFTNIVKSETEVKRTWLSSQGVECATPCATSKGSDDFWCLKVHKGWDHCSRSPLLDYRGNKCENSCGQYGKSYNWCWIKGGSWGYCSPGGNEVYVKHFGSKTGKECTSTCSKHKGTTYYWCQVEGGWEYCSPSEGRNAAGTECATPCKADKTTYTWCNDPDKNWQYCSSVSKTFQGTCLASKLEIANPMPVPTKPQGSVSKRFADSTPFSGKADPKNINLCQNLAKEYFALNPKLKHTIRKSGPDNPVDEFWYSEEGNGNLLHIIHSTIYHHHRECPKTEFVGDEFKKQLQFMGAKAGDTIKRGHIVSSNLCGPAEWYNLAPQRDSRCRSLWFLQEEWFADMLDHNPCVYVDHWVTLMYEGSNNRRPTHFQLCFAFKDKVNHRLMSGPDTLIIENKEHELVGNNNKIVADRADPGPKFTRKTCIY